MFSTYFDQDCRLDSRIVAINDAIITKTWYLTQIIMLNGFERQWILSRNMRYFNKNFQWYPIAFSCSLPPHNQHNSVQIVTSILEHSESGSNCLSYHCFKILCSISKTPWLPSVLTSLKIFTATPPISNSLFSYCLPLKYSIFLP